MNLNEIQKKLEEEIQESQAGDEIVLLSEAAEKKERETNFERFDTGMNFFDSVAKLRDTDRGGLAGGELLVIAAPTGNGKTTLAATLTHHFLKKVGISSLWFTYEISVFSLWKIFEKMGTAKDDILCVPAEHTTGKLEWVEKKIGEAKQKFDTTKVVVIDHLGFLAPFQRMNQQMTQNYSSYLGQIVRELKTIAVRENIIIILPVHMVKSASDDPSLRDIGHSGGIAQEADFVLLLAREEEKNREMQSKSYYTERTKVILAKNRVGGETPTWWMTRDEYGRLITSFQKYEQPAVWGK